MLAPHESLTRSPLTPEQEQLFAPLHAKFLGALSAMTAWMLIANWRHTRRRMRTQQALMTETNFRRAMENSMLTGMRALDLHGRITYVNAAFCQMTGWSEAELVGRTPPFPYWPE